MLGLDTSTQNTLMILIFAIVMVVEFAILITSMLRSKDRKIQKYILDGGFTKAELVSKEDLEKGVLCHYVYYVDDQRYKLDVTLKKAEELIDVYYNPKKPSVAYTLAGESIWKRNFYQFTPIIAITILLLAYKIIYG